MQPPLIGTQPLEKTSKVNKRTRMFIPDSRVTNFKKGPPYTCLSTFVFRNFRVLLSDTNINSIPFMKGNFFYQILWACPHFISKSSHGPAVFPFFAFLPEETIILKGSFHRLKKAQWSGNKTFKKVQKFDMIF